MHVICRFPGFGLLLSKESLPFLIIYRILGYPFFSIRY